MPLYDILCNRGYTAAYYLYEILCLWLPFIVFISYTNYRSGKAPYAGPRCYVLVTGATVKHTLPLVQVRGISRCGKYYPAAAYYSAGLYKGNTKIG